MSNPNTPTARFQAYGGKAPTPERRPTRHVELRARLDCHFPAVDDIFDDCVDHAATHLSEGQRSAWIDQARWLGKLGRGPEAVLVFLEVWPGVASTLAAHGGAAAVALGQAALASLMQAMQKSPNGRALPALLQSLGAVARRLKSPALLAEYFALVRHHMERTQISVHGHHATEPSPSLPALLAQAPTLVAKAPLAGLRRWVDAGIRLHGAHPQRQQAYFALQSAEAQALLQRERQGVLLADVERQLELTLRGLWGEPAALIAYPVDAAVLDDDVAAPAGAHPTQPYSAADGWRLPEVLQDHAGVSALDRYRARLAHLAAHRLWSRPQWADNWSPLQRLAVETFEDARVDHLLLQRLPGLRPVLQKLHPAPAALGAERRADTSYLRHRLARLSRALLVGTGDADDPAQQAFVSQFHSLLHPGPADTAAMAELALQWAARTRVQSDQLARVHFLESQVDYRDDNRHLWRFIEEGDEEDTAGDANATTAQAEEPQRLPPRLYPEWDARAGSQRPDWASVYDMLQPAGEAAQIDALLLRHASAARHLKRLLDLLKPQDRTRVRRQEEGSELDLDMALRSLIDWRAGAQPDPRVMMSTRTAGRDIAVLLLVDLSESVNDAVPGSAETVLSLSRAAAALLAWAIDTLGDELAIAGFHSNTRHEVRYLHIKGFTEAWGDAPKARLAGTQGAWSTRMGAALRHGGHLLSGRRAPKRLLLVLTDGEPADVDESDPAHLLQDAAQAVRELKQAGLYTHCISLDARATDYAGRIFGAGHTTVVDRVEQLPRRLPEVFLSLTR